MKKTIFPIALFFCFTICKAQNWTWISGDSVKNSKGLYGTKGIAGPLNKPGARKLMAGWTDTSGNYWVYSGRGFAASDSGLLNDMWRYSVADNNWTWITGDSVSRQKSQYGIKGIAASTNNPGAREQSMWWTDSAGNFWLYGGFGFGNSNQGSLSDVWKFDVNTLQWTWMSGDSTVNEPAVYIVKGQEDPISKPGGRFGAINITDMQGHLWLYGGMKNNTPGNDLWRYNILTNNWMWVTGDSSRPYSFGFPSPWYPMQAGAFRTESATYTPGGRMDGIGWANSLNHLFLFSGRGNNGNRSGSMNDVWRFNVNTGMWAFWGGTQFTGGTSSPDPKVPTMRELATGQLNQNGKLIIYGGTIGGQSFPFSYLGDSHSYEEGSNNWQSIKINYCCDLNHGTKGVSSSSNIVGSRVGMVSFKSKDGNFWIFGGQAVLPNPYGSAALMNDLWRLSVPGNTLPLYITSFTAVKNNYKVNLVWKTAVASPVKYYTVLHSKNGLHYDSIGSVNGINNSNETRYSFSHATPVQGSNYYKLRQVSYDNKWEYSETRKVEFNAAALSFSINQNPALNKLVLNVSLNKASKVSFEITDIGGRIITTKSQALEAGLAPYNINISTFPKGTYTITISNGESRVTKSFIKQ